MKKHLETNCDFFNPEIIKEPWFIYLKSRVTKTLSTKPPLNEKEKEWQEFQIEIIEKRDSFFGIAEKFLGEDYTTWFKNKLILFKKECCRNEVEKKAKEILEEYYTLLPTERLLILKKILKENINSKFVRYSAWHILTLSGTDFETSPKLDLPGKYSIKLFLERCEYELKKEVLKENGVEKE